MTQSQRILLKRALGCNTQMEGCVRRKNTAFPAHKSVLTSFWFKKIATGPVNKAEIKYGLPIGKRGHKTQALLSELASDDPNYRWLQLVSTRNRTTTCMEYFQAPEGLRKRHVNQATPRRCLPDPETDLGRNSVTCTSGWERDRDVDAARRGGGNACVKFLCKL